jgi:hypothetical protein
MTTLVARTITVLSFMTTLLARTITVLSFMTTLVARTITVLSFMTTLLAFIVVGHVRSARARLLPAPALAWRRYRTACDM